MSGAATKLTYRPSGLLLGASTGMISVPIFNQV